MVKQKLFLPGWAVPNEAYSGYFHANDIECIDFHFFGESSEVFNFDNKLAEISSKITEPTILFAHSMGTLFALKLANSSKNIKGLVLFSPFAKFVEDKEYIAQEEKNVRSMKTFIKKRPKIVLKNFYSDLFSPQKDSLPIPDNLNNENLYLGLDLLQNMDLRDELQKIKVPALIIIGEKDKIVPKETSLYVANNLSTSKVLLVEDMGHSIPITNKNYYKDEVNDFINKI
jgi:pimeloyl-[acyl-carrier protein] methyl ester esterase